MLPILLDLKFFKIYTQGIFLLLAFFWGSFLLWKVIRLSSYKEEDVFDGMFSSLLGGILGARVVYVALNFKDFGFDILRFLLINGYPGLSLYGGLAGGLIAFIWFFYSRKAKWNEVSDYFIPSLFLAVAVGKLGAFFSGSEVGTKTTFILAVKYANMTGLRHLTPFYESVLFFAGAWISYKLLFDIRRERYERGFNFVFFCWLFSLVTLLFDKGKEYRLYFMGRSFNATVSALLLLTFSFYFVYYFRSFLLKKIRDFINIIFHYAKKTFQGVHSKTKKRSPDRGEKNTHAN